MVEAETTAPAAEVEEKQSRRDAIRAENAERKARPERRHDEHKRSRDWRRDDDGPSPIGFGDDIPAFMLIEPPVKNVTQGE